MSRVRRSHGLQFAIELMVLLALACEHCDSLIITSVIAGNKKFKTVSFDSKFLKPLTFEKDLPTTEFRRHRTVRPPKFDIDVNIPIKLPLEDEYPQEEYKKPVESNFFFQSGDIGGGPSYPTSYNGVQKQQQQQQQPKYPTKQQATSYTDEQYAAASTDDQSQSDQQPGASTLMRDGLKGLLPTLAKSIKFTPKIEYNGLQAQPNARSDAMPTVASQQQQQFYPPAQQLPMPQPQPITNQFDPMSQAASYPAPSYPQQQQPQQQHYQQSSNGYEQQDFVPGGFVNLQLSGPTGGPKMTYEDYDKERWAQQLSQTDGAMPYPVLNYHQLQNFYGGLGTFTNGLAEHRYVEHGLLDKFKSSLNHLAGKFHHLG